MGATSCRTREPGPVGYRNLKPAENNARRSRTVSRGISADPTGPCREAKRPHQWGGGSPAGAPHPRLERESSAERPEGPASDLTPLTAARPGPILWGAESSEGAPTGSRSRGPVVHGEQAVGGFLGLPPVSRRSWGAPDGRVESGGAPSGSTGLPKTISWGSAAGGATEGPDASGGHCKAKRAPTTYRDRAHWPGPFVF